MRIAVIDSFPNSARRDHRLIPTMVTKALERFTTECRTVVTTDDVMSFAPDLVIIVFPSTPKLTAFPTVGLIWEDITTLDETPLFRRNTLSLDGYICSDDACREYLDDLQFGIGCRKPIAPSYLPASMVGLLKSGGEKELSPDDHAASVTALSNSLCTALPILLEEVKKEGCFEAQLDTSARAHEPMIQVIVRAGGRSLDMLDRAVTSLMAANSATAPLGIVLVDFAHRSDIRAYAALTSRDGLDIRYVESPNNGLRSTTFWTGLNEITAPYVAMLDDDDTVFPNHYLQLLQTLCSQERYNVAYSGAIKVQDDPGCFVQAANFDGDEAGIVREMREIAFLDRFDLQRLLRLDNFIQSNAWLARSSFVRSLMGSDPRMEVAGAFLLYILLASRGPFAFTGSATAVWHWRSSTRDNSMLQVDKSVFAEAGRRIKRRLRDVAFVSEPTPEQAYVSAELSGLRAALAVSEVAAAERLEALEATAADNGKLRAALAVAEVAAAERLEALEATAADNGKLRAALAVAEVAAAERLEALEATAADNGKLRAALGVSEVAAAERLEALEATAADNGKLRAALAVAEVAAAERLEALEATAADNGKLRAALAVFEVAAAERLEALEATAAENGKLRAALCLAKDDSQ